MPGLHPLSSFLVKFQVVNLSQVSAPSPTLQAWKENETMTLKVSPAPNYSVWLQISCSLEELVMYRDSRANKCRDGDKGGRKFRWAPEWGICLSVPTVSYFRFRWLKKRVECRKGKGIGFEFCLKCILKQEPTDGWWVMEEKLSRSRIWHRRWNGSDIWQGLAMTKIEGTLDKKQAGWMQRW